MGTGAAIAIAAGALVLVFIVTKKQEQQTAMRAQSITNAKNSAGLSAGDVVKGTLAGVATAYGGPGAGAAVLGASGERL